MKHIKFGNLVSEVSQGIIIHGCNAQGVMNSGIAKEIRETYPDNFLNYKRYCDSYGMDRKYLLGKVCWFQPHEGLWIANAITQLNYGRDPNTQYVDYEAIQKAFNEIVSHVVHGALSTFNGNTHLNYPTIGAGLGNGDWSVINDIIETECYNARLHGSKCEIDRTLWLLPKKY